MRFSVGLLILICIAFAPLTSSASHMIGGGFSYTYLSTNKYLIELEYYKDCSPSAIGYPPRELRVGIYGKSKDNLITTIDLMPGEIKPIEFVLGSCSNSPVTCVQKRIYSDTLYVLPNLFTDTNGYYFSYEQCCRNFGIKNVDKPDQSGMTFYIEFPSLIVNNKVFVNSSPKLKNEQFFYLCVNDPFVADYSYTDPDGDSLVYSLINPLKGSTTSSNNNSNGISILNPGPYDEVNWATGYGPVALNYLDGQPDLSINDKTGLLTITPKQSGLYSFAIRVEEYRNGERISIVNREVQYQIIICPTTNSPEITWLNANEDQIFAETKHCLLFTGTDIDVSDSLSAYLTDISANMSTQKLEVTIDTTQKNPITISVCIETDCSLISGQNEGFKLYLTDRACPRPKLDSMYVPLEFVALDMKDPLEDIPNVFTPNKDGLNDYFSIDNGYAKSCIEDFSVVIFNRWGDKVFESEDFSFQWSGDQLPTGVYFYVIKFGKREKAGSILLMF